MGIKAAIQSDWHAEPKYDNREAGRAQIQSTVFKIYMMTEKRERVLTISSTLKTTEQTETQFTHKTTNCLCLSSQLKKMKRGL